MGRTGAGLLTPDSTHQRIYDFWFATEEQLRLRALANYADYQDNYVTQLRLDLLAFKTAIIPDTAVIDGWFFGQVTPEDLAEWCGRGVTRLHLPVEVMTRMPTLESSFATFLRRSDRETLNDYPLQLLNYQDARDAVASGLRETSASRLDKLLTLESSVPKAIARLLVEILRAQGVEHDTVGEFLPFWEAWIDAERSGFVKVRQWDKTIDVMTAARSDPLNLNDELLTEQGRAAYIEVARLIAAGTLTKSDALNVLKSFAPMRADANTGHAYEMDKRIIVAWYDTTRCRAIAKQHQSTFTYDQIPIYPLGYRGLAAIPDILDLDKSSIVEIPEDFRKVLRGMEPARYRSLFTIYRKEFEELWANPNRSNLHRTMELTYDYAASERQAIASSKAERVVRVFGQLLAAGAAEQIAGPLAGLGMILASEGAFHIADSSRRRRAVRGVIEYLKLRQ